MSQLYSMEFIYSLKNKVSAPVPDKDLDFFVKYYNSITVAPKITTFAKQPIQKQRVGGNKIKGLLNKISKNNYRDLIDELIKELNENENYAAEENDIIQLILNKVWYDNTYYELYVNICKVIWNVKPTFRRALLNACQREFLQTDTRIKEYDAIVGDDNSDAEMELVAEKKQEINQKIIGTIKFIGYMNNAGVIKEQILVDCVAELLKFDVAKINKKHIECVQQLFVVVDHKKLTEQQRSLIKKFLTQLLESEIFDNDNRTEFILEELIQKFSN